MIRLGVQTKNIVEDSAPEKGFEMIKDAGFSCCDFSLNSYLTNTALYKSEINPFFDKTEAELEHFFTPHKQGAGAAEIFVNQMHMPYPNYIPKADKWVNEYLRNVVAPKSLAVCSFLECPHIVIHGFKLAYYLGSEEAEWERTESFLDSLAPMAKERGITLCVENLYTSVGEHLMEGPCCNARKAAERIDRFNEKHGQEVLGFCFDTGHANLVGLDFEDFLTTLGGRLKVLHIHDNDGVGDLHQIPFTFTRTRENAPSTDWEGFLLGLKKIHFDKVLSFETAPVLTSFPEPMKKEALEFIGKVGKYFAGQLEGTAVN